MTETHEKDKVVFAATMASTFEPDSMTNDKIEAATKGHGALVIPVFAAANSIAEDLACNRWRDQILAFFSFHNS